MEVAGFAIGVASLVSLFSTCAQAINQIEAYRDFEPDSRRLKTRLELEKLRFQRWGESVGIADGKLDEKHHRHLDDPVLQRKIKETLWIIRDILVDTQGRLHAPPINDEDLQWSTATAASRKGRGSKHRAVTGLSSRAKGLFGTTSPDAR